MLGIVLTAAVLFIGGYCLGLLRGSEQKNKVTFNPDWIKKYKRDENDQRFN